MTPHGTREDVLGLDDLFAELRRRGWTLILWGPKHAPDLLAATFTWDTCTDVLIVRNEHQATGYRLPTLRSGAIFNPEAVSYQYHQSPLWTLRAMLALPAPGTAGAPCGVERPKHPECALPDGLPDPITIRPLAAVHTGRN